jgi:hypothetical protein
MAKVAVQFFVWQFLVNLSVGFVRLFVVKIATFAYTQTVMGKLNRHIG